MRCKCGNKIEIRIYHGKRDRSYFPKYCSRACAYKYRTRPTGLSYDLKVKNSGWFKNKGGCLDGKGYNKIHIGSGKYQREHRHVMEKYLGRKLLNSEVVHHKNSIKTDNRIKNLVIMSKYDHDKLHNGKSIK